MSARIQWLPTPPRDPVTQALWAAVAPFVADVAERLRGTVVDPDTLGRPGERYLTCEDGPCRGAVVKVVETVRGGQTVEVPLWQDARGPDVGVHVSDWLTYTVRDGGLWEA